MTSTTGATIAALQTETRAYPAPAGDWNVGPVEAERLRGKLEAAGVPHQVESGASRPTRRSMWPSEPFRNDDSNPSVRIAGVPMPLF